MKEDNLGLKNVMGEKSREIICSEQHWYSFVL